MCRKTSEIFQCAFTLWKMTRGRRDGSEHRECVFCYPQVTVWESWSSWDGIRICPTHSPFVEGILKKTVNVMECFLNPPLVSSLCWELWHMHTSLKFDYVFIHFVFVLWTCIESLMWFKVMSGCLSAKEILLCGCKTGTLSLMYNIYICKGNWKSR